MFKRVDISLVDPNPFNVRDKESMAMSAEAIDSLAAEIKERGWHEAPLRARKVGNRYQIAFGHRRLLALKKLKTKYVQLDVLKLSDSEMKLDMAAENFQRHGLTNAEKLKCWGAVKAECGGASEKARKFIGISAETAAAYNKALEYDGLSQVPEMTPMEILAADRLGGKPMVEQAAKSKLNARQLKQISAQIKKEAYTAPDIKEELTAAVIEGKIKTPEGVKRRADKIRDDLEFEKLGLTSHRKDYLPDLVTFVYQWSSTLPEITSKLQAVAEHAEYVFEKDPHAAARLYPILDELYQASKLLRSKMKPRIGS